MEKARGCSWADEPIRTGEEENAAAVVPTRTNTALGGVIKFGVCVKMIPFLGDHVGRVCMMILFLGRA